jgi:hypothetical protein
MNSFQSYPLSDEAILQGSILNHTQKQVIHNARTLIAEQILSLSYDPANPHEFVQNDAHLKGQLAAFTFLLDRSTEVEQSLLRSNQSN